jgi:PII-like signaling protein
MENNSSVSLMRIFVSSTDKDGHQPLYESIVFKAREFGLAGATVTRGILGFGASSVIHSYKFWEVTEKIPVIVEVIDNEEKVDAFYQTVAPMLESMRFGCMVTRQKIDILLNQAGSKKQH